MKHNNEGLFKQAFSLDSRTGGLQREDLGDVPLFGATRRFSCIFLSTSTKDAAKLNHHLSAAGIRVYLARDTREAEVLLAALVAWQDLAQEVSDPSPIRDRRCPQAGPSGRPFGST